MMLCSVGTEVSEPPTFWVCVFQMLHSCHSTVTFDTKRLHIVANWSSGGGAGSCVRMNHSDGDANSHCFSADKVSSPPLKDSSLTFTRHPAQRHETQMTADEGVNRQTHHSLVTCPSNVQTHITLFISMPSGTF